MVDLARVLQFQYPTARPLVDYEVINDGTTTRISRWNTARLGPQPTLAELTAIRESAAYIAWLARKNRQPRSLGDISTDIQSLSVPDRNRLLNAIAADFLRRNPDFARELGIPVDGAQ